MLTRPELSMKSKVSGFSKQTLRALGPPALGLGATFFAYGTQTSLAGFSLFESFLATAFIYAVPGQLIVVEQSEIGATIFSVFLSVLFVNMRLLPMTMAVMPKIKHKYLLLNLINAHFVALTTWLGFLKAAPELERNPSINPSHFYFFFGFILWNIGWIMSSLGYLSRDWVSPEIQLALVYANPLYFLLLLLEQTQNKQNFLPIILGGALLPLATLISLEWSILMAGFVGGTLAFLINSRK